MQIAKKALEDQGYEVVPFNFTIEEVVEIKNIYIGLLSNVYAGPLLRESYRNFERPKSMYFLTNIYYNANFLTRALLKTVLYLLGNKRTL
jgi:hypothetical protein